MRQDENVKQAINEIRDAGFWFIDIPRTSSSGIRVQLGEKYGSLFNKMNLTEKQFSRPQVLADHLPANFMKNLLGDDLWDRIFTFTLVRNPWDRVFSLYNFRKKKGGLPSDMSFSDYVYRLGNSFKKKDPLFAYHGHFLSAWRFVSDGRGNSLVDFIGKFENRNADLSIIAEKIGFPGLGSFRIQQASPVGARYSDYYDDATAQLIGEIYRDDIERFGYCFD